MLGKKKDKTKKSAAAETADAAHETTPSTPTHTSSTSTSASSTVKSPTALSASNKSSSSPAINPTGSITTSTTSTSKPKEKKGGLFRMSVKKPQPPVSTPPPAAEPPPPAIDVADLLAGFSGASYPPKGYWTVLDKDIPPNPQLQVFQIPLEELAARKDSVKGIPAVIEHCFLHLENSGLGVEGIFRVAGRPHLITELHVKFNAAEGVDLSEFSTHDVSTILKKFFVELPESPIPMAILEPVPVPTNPEEEAASVKLLREAVRTLPDYAYQLLKRLFLILQNTAALEEQNKMSADNLCRLFGPLVCRADTANATLLTPKHLAMIDNINQLTKVMIVNASEVFKHRHPHRSHHDDDS